MIDYFGTAGKLHSSFQKEPTTKAKQPLTTCRKEASRMFKIQIYSIKIKDRHGRNKTLWPYMVAGKTIMMLHIKLFQRTLLNHLAKHQLLNLLQKKYNNLSSNIPKMDVFGVNKSHEKAPCLIDWCSCWEWVLLVL